MITNPLSLSCFYDDNVIVFREIINNLLILMQCTDFNYSFHKFVVKNVKFLQLLNTNQYVKLSRDPTKQIETKIQRMSRKNKTNISLQKYSCLYSTESSPDKFYGTAKIY